MLEQVSHGGVSPAVPLGALGGDAPVGRSIGKVCGVGVVETARDKDRRIAMELAALSHADADYWTFRRGAARGRAHGLAQYPAKMVPQMQAALLAVVAKADAGARSALDPFCGAGTTLVECMRRGFGYAGQDVNPLGVLFCRAKAGPFDIGRLASAVDAVLLRAAADGGAEIEADFRGLDKWFTPAVAITLSRIRRAIRREPHLWCRRVLWSAMAETVRLCSNSRTSTFKLHIRSAEDLASRRVDPLATFTGLISDIVARLRDEADALREAGHLASNGCYRGEIQIALGDSRSSVPVTTAAGHDLLITSPPYGDNTSTVPYGQCSFLPLQWIDLHDIDEALQPDVLASTHEIDSRSLGGSRRHPLRGIKELLARTPSLAATLSPLETLPADRRNRVAAFCRDLDSCLDPVLGALRPDAYMIWTVGNRRVGGQRVPTDAILSELLQRRRARLLATIQRRIPNKRMATRNNIACTMRGETILVFRKG